jgi:excisionase family DNA binding protein
MTGDPQRPAELTRVLVELVIAELAADCGLTPDQLRAALARLAAGDANERPPSLDAPLSVADVASRVGLDHQVVRRAINRGDLTAYKLGSRLVVYESDFERWRSSCQVMPAASNTRAGRARAAPRSRPPGGLRRLLETTSSEA